MLIGRGRVNWAGLAAMLCLATVLASACSDTERDFADAVGGSAGGANSPQAGNPTAVAGSSTMPSTGGTQPTAGAEANSGGGGEPAVSDAGAGAGGTPPEEPCNGADLNSDPLNCGECEFSCVSSPNLSPNAEGITCQTGTCNIPDSACAPGKKHCTADPLDVCETDVTTSERCGACETKCGAGQLCSDGKCVDKCPAGQAECATPQGTGCYALATSAAHCGTCETTCAEPAANGAAACAAGKCKIVCSSGYHQCGSSARCESDTDVDNCGSTCKVCETADPHATAQCKAGSCSYPCNGGYQACGGTCVSNNDPKNCGGCGNVCASSQSCVSGDCLIKDGYDCVAPGDCVSGTCGTFYVDADGDTHGAASGPKKVCGSTPPAGYVTSKDDCCDVGGDAASIFPGQTKWFLQATTSCSKGWDYDCSSNVEKQYPNLISKVCSVMGGCTSSSAWTDSAVPDCSFSGSLSPGCIGKADTGTGMICIVVNAFATPQGCH